MSYDAAACPAPAAAGVAPPRAMASREFVVQGVTHDGRTFRPSDWAERLASAMSCFRPGGHVGGIGAFIGYSPYCVPTVVGTLRCVIVNDALKRIEPMAWDFVINFAHDNHLQLSEVHLAPPPPAVLN